MRLSEIVGRQLQEEIEYDTEMLLLALHTRSQLTSPQATPVNADDPTGIIASQILCLAGLATLEPMRLNPRMVGYYVITDKGKEKATHIRREESIHCEDSH